MMRMLLTTPLLLLLLLLASCGNYYLLPVSSYVTSPNALPLKRQINYLQELTSDVVQADLGQLSKQQVSASHDLMHAWKETCRSKHAALQVESLLKRLIDERKAGNKEASLDLTIDDYNCVLEGWAKSNLGEFSASRTEEILETLQEQGPLPNLASFKACFMAWKMSHVEYAGVRAQRILEWMIRLYQNGDNENALPDADCFDMLLQIKAKSGKSPEDTEKLLVLMERLHKRTDNDKLKPRHTSFNAVLASWGRSGRPDAAERSAHILKFMEYHRVTDAASYNTVMNTFAKTLDPLSAAWYADDLVRHVVQLVQQQEQQHDDDDHDSGTTASQQPHNLQPDTIMFNTAMGLWAKTKNQRRSYRRARSILDRQVHLADNNNRLLQPDVFGWTSVISSCANEPVERQKAFQVALSTYRQMQNQDVNVANFVTYGTMLRAIARLLPKGSEQRQKWTRKVFVDACDTGCVGDMVVSKLREAATNELYRELMQGHTRKSLPKAWTRNVSKDDSRQSRKQRKRAEV